MPSGDLRMRVAASLVEAWGRRSETQMPGPGVYHAWAGKMIRLTPLTNLETDWESQTVAWYTRVPRRWRSRFVFLRTQPSPFVGPRASGLCEDMAPPALVGRGERNSRKRAAVVGRSTRPIRLVNLFHALNRMGARDNPMGYAWSQPWHNGMVLSAGAKAG